MKSLPRIIAALGILILAVAGCQKGSRTGKAQSANEEGGAQAGSETKESDTATHGSASTAEGTTAPRHAEHGASTLTQPDDGKTVDLRAGQTVVVVLDSNHENGFNWVLLDSKANVIAQDGAPAYAPAGPKKENGTETWRFHAVRPGEETVRMEYRRAMAQHLPERTFRFTATVR
jgi:predicted secreted protein